MKSQAAFEPSCHPTDDVAHLAAAYTLSRDLIARFATDGHLTVPQVFTPSELAVFELEFTAKVMELNHQHQPLESRDTYQRAFLQVGNLWRHSELIERFVRSTRLARLAAELMGCRGVRLYHDQALYKEASGGHTPWHCDQQYWPLDNPRCVTAWIPLQDTPVEMGPVAFASGSQDYTGGRHLPISDESEEVLSRGLGEGGYRCREEPIACGDVSFHLGWTYHRAGPNTTGRCRKVMTIIYMDMDTRVAAPQTPSQENDRRSICPDVPIGGVIDTPLTPVLYSA